ncbi:MAG: ABC transporter ATP-binding protein [Candidatus Rokubacteria bacterium]|nr:ABC transporter ATP-binding protein [Candidatus Rokubacteria bacterium]
MTPVPVLAVVDVSRRHSPAFSLVIPSLDVRPGEVLAVIGPNGSGKSTLLRLLGFLEAPDEGEVRFHGLPVDANRSLVARRRVAMVFQQPLLADVTAADNVALGLGFHGVARTERERRVSRWLDRFAIGGLAGRPARTLSGGEAQRVALARALVLEPEVLLLDEPFAGLDEPTRAALIPELGAVLRAERMTTVLVTHDRGEARALADRVAVLIGGRLHQVDETARVFQAPVSEDVARFVGVETIADGEVIAAAGGVSLVDVAGRKVEVGARARPGERVRICIRPEDITLAPSPEASALTSARNHLAGTVVQVTPSSPQVRVLLDCGFPLVAAVTPRSVDELGLRPGLPITAIFKASAVHLIAGASYLDTPAPSAL